MSLKTWKQHVIEAAHSTGTTASLLDSKWRQERLLILCYHGVSLDDEHVWNPRLYVTPDRFRERLETLAELRCNVLSLENALKALYLRKLPPRSVTITFDDGTYDLLSLGAPLLREFRFPATCYLTSYYSQYNQPVFDVMCSYLLWKAGAKRFALPGVLQEPIVDLTRENAPGLARRIRDYAISEGFSGIQKTSLLIDLAARLEVDYDAICRKRILHLVTGAEASRLSESGISVQLHTHRHRVSRDRDLFRREIIQNYEVISSVTGTQPRHFCYPSGAYLPEFPEWLRELGVASATTCVPGLATPDTDPMLLPRLVDSSGISNSTFRSWVSGFASLLPKRSNYVPKPEMVEALSGDSNRTRPTSSNAPEQRAPGQGDDLFRR